QANGRPLAAARRWGLVAAEQVFQKTAHVNSLAAVVAAQTGKPPCGTPAGRQSTRTEKLLAGMCVRAAANLFQGHCRPLPGPPTRPRPALWGRRRRVRA